MSAFVPPVRMRQPRRRVSLRMAIGIAGLSGLSCLVGPPPAAGESEGPSAPASPKASAAERVHAEARRILAEMKDSRYSHKTRVDEDEGSYEFDCSGFVAVVLKAAVPRSLAAVPHAPRRSRPLAFEFHDAFAAAPAEEPGAKGWRRIERVADARPGDLLAWRREEIKAGEDTGHVMVVDAAPVREDDGQFRVVVLDSTGKPHGDDTRKDGATGVGRGTIWLTVDEAGRPSGFRWRARDGALVRRPLAIGRAMEDGSTDGHR